MPITTTIRVIYLGQHSDLDPNERYTGAENANQLIGNTFGSANSPLAREIVAVNAYDGNSNSKVSFNSNSGNPRGEYATENGTTHYIDTGVLYRGTVTYMNGTSASNVPLRVVQDTNGNLALLPPPRSADASEINALTTQPIQSIRITGVLQNNFDGIDTSRYGLEDAPVFVCFRNGTLILTARGNVAVEDLRAGDMVMTRDHGLQPLRWIGSKQVTSELQQLFPQMRPVRIGAGALGAGLPERDLYVSQQHRILVSGKIAERVLGEEEVLVAAKHLTDIAGIEIDDSAEELHYFHLLFDRHEIVCSEGAQTESLFTGPEAMKAVSPEARAEILALFPELLAEGRAHEPARRLGSGREGRQLAKRHSANGRELQTALPR